MFPLRSLSSSNDPLKNESYQYSSLTESEESRVNALTQNILNLNIGTLTFTRKDLLYTDRLVQKQRVLFENTSSLIFLYDTKKYKIKPTVKGYNWISIDRAVRGVEVRVEKDFIILESIPQFINILAVVQREIKRISFYFGGEFIAKGSSKAAYCFPMVLQANLDNNLQLKNISISNTNDKVILIWISNLRQNRDGMSYLDSCDLSYREELSSKYHLLSELVTEGSSIRSNISLPEILDEESRLSIADRCDKLFNDMIRTISIDDIYI